MGSNSKSTKYDKVNGGKKEWCKIVFLVSIQFNSKVRSKLKQSINNESVSVTVRETERAINIEK